MKVVFLQDVPNVAKAGEAREVSDGYGRNFLLPKKLAVLNKSGTAEKIKAQLESKVETEKFLELARELEGKHVTIQARVGTKKERLHGSITSAHIAEELEKSAGLIVDKRKIDLAEPIHQLGDYEIAIKLAKDITPKIKVFVIEKEKEAEKESPKETKAEKEPPAEVKAKEPEVEQKAE